MLPKLLLREARVLRCGAGSNSGPSTQSPTVGLPGPRLCFCRNIIATCARVIRRDLALLSRTKGALVPTELGVRQERALLTGGWCGAEPYQTSAHPLDNWDVFAQHTHGTWDADVWWRAQRTCSGGGSWMEPSTHTLRHGAHRAAGALTCGQSCVRSTKQRNCVLVLKCPSGSTFPPSEGYLIGRSTGP